MCVYIYIHTYIYIYANITTHVTELRKTIKLYSKHKRKHGKQENLHINVNEAVQCILLVLDLFSLRNF
jgi:hypothetical protein